MGKITLSCELAFLSVSAVRSNTIYIAKAGYTLRVFGFSLFGIIFHCLPWLQKNRFRVSASFFIGYLAWLQNNAKM